MNGIFDKEKRKVSYEYYIISINVVMLILLVGALIYVVIDNKRLQSKHDDSLTQENNYMSLQLQYALMGDLIANSSNSCRALNSALEDSISDLGYSLDKITQYKKESVNDVYYETLQRKYILDNVKYWIFARKANELCSLNKVIIMYFYSDNCAICPDQGVLLTYYKKKYEENILIFPINTDDAKTEPVIKMLLSSYDVQNFPTLVINDQRYEGMIYKEQLANILADEFSRFVKNEFCYDNITQSSNDSSYFNSTNSTRAFS